MIFYEVQVRKYDYTFCNGYFIPNFNVDRLIVDRIITINKSFFASLSRKSHKSRLRSFAF